MLLKQTLEEMRERKENELSKKRNEEIKQELEKKLNNL